MNPRKPLNHWQLFAQPRAAAISGFAPTHFDRQDGLVGSSGPCGSAPHCYPFPFFWLSPFGVGPLFSAPFARGRDRRAFANAEPGQCGHGPKTSFAHPDAALVSEFITTSTRGVTSCGNSSLYSSSQPRLRPACRTPARAQSRVPLLARPLPIRPTKTWLPVPRLAGLPVLPAAPFPARSAADCRDLIASATGHPTTLATHGAFPVGGFSFPAPVAALT